MPQDSVTQGQEAVTGSPRHQTVLLSQYGEGKALPTQLHMWKACWGHLPKLGSLGHPFSFTPRELVSMRKCLTSSLVKSPGKR